MIITIGNTPEEYIEAAEQLTAMAEEMLQNQTVVKVNFTGGKP